MYDFFQIRTLLLQQKRSSCSENRYIKHFHYLTWPAYPQRNCTTTFLQFLNRLHERLEIPEEDKNDVVRHLCKRQMMKLDVLTTRTVSYLLSSKYFESFRVLQLFIAMMVVVEQAHFWQLKLIYI